VDQVEPGLSGEAPFKVRDHPFFDLERDDFVAATEQLFRECAGTGAYLDNDAAGGHMHGLANVPKDAAIAQEMLAQRLPG
jgi:hypothetical protein